MKNTIIIILSIAVIALGGYLVYDKVMVEDSKCIEKEIPDNKDDNNNSETIVRDKDEYVGLALSRYAMIEWYLSDKIDGDPDYIVRNIELPKILFDTENAKKLNEKIYNDYIDDINNLSVKTENPYDFSITYNYSIKDSILSLMVEKSAGSSRGSSRITRKVYYYDMKNDKELSQQEIAKMFNITLDKVKKDSSNENNKNVKEISLIMPFTNVCVIYYTTEVPATMGSEYVAHIKY